MRMSQLELEVEFFDTHAQVKIGEGGTELEVLYAVNPTFTSAGVTKSDVEDGTKFRTVAFVDADGENINYSREQVFIHMQGEWWSPDGEARDLIKSLDLKHTSMSVGDVLRETETGRTWVCASAGWEELTDV